MRSEAFFIATGNGVEEYRSKDYGKICVKTFGSAASTLLLIIFILFAILEYMPGSSFNDERLSDDQIAVLNEKYGLDQPSYYSV